MVPIGEHYEAGKRKEYESRANMKSREITDFFLSVVVITKGYTVAGPSLDDYKLS